MRSSKFLKRVPGAHQVEEMTQTLYFDPTDKRIKTEAEWRRLAGRYRPEIAVKKHAEQHGAAGMWNKDGSLLLIYKVEGSPHMKARRYALAEPRHDPTKGRKG